MTGEKSNGEQVMLYETDRNLVRNFLLPVRDAYRKIMLVINSNYGDTEITPVFSFDVK